jgi:hypothetical protein
MDGSSICLFACAYFCFQCIGSFLDDVAPSNRYRMSFAMRSRIGSFLDDTCCRIVVSTCVDGYRLLHGCGGRIGSFLDDIAPYGWTSFSIYVRMAVAAEAACVKYHNDVTVQ